MGTPVLERFHWRRTGSTAWVRLPGENVVGTFDTATEADAEQGRLEAETRAVVGHPFRCGSTLAELTTLPDYAFLDWLRDTDIDPPDFDPDGRRPWLAWADLYSAEWTPSQLAHVWEGCNRVRFFRVREQVGEVLHCVLRIYHAREFTPEYIDVYLAESEGGTPVSLWHSRTAAEADLQSKQRLAAEEVVAATATIGDDGLQFDPSRRVAAGRPFAVVPPVTPTGAREAVHCDLIEVERGDTGGEPPGETAFVVLRLGWDQMTDDAAVEVPGLFDRRDEAGGVPVRVFARREDAERFRDGCGIEYRAFGNPFALWMPAARGYGWESDRVVRAILDIGLIPPDLDTPPRVNPYTAQRAELVRWWSLVGDRLSETQRAALWELNWDYDRQHALYAVREVRVGDAAPRPPRRVRTMYYVRATTWAPDSGPGMNPHRFLGAFADREKAEAVRDEAERRFREAPPPDQPPPVTCEPDRPWDWYSSMTEDEALRRLIDEGLPAYSVRMSDWWHHSSRPFRPEQVRAVWQVLDRVRLYEVLALPTEVAE